jgi:hypothetical protein
LDGGGVGGEIGVQPCWRGGLVEGDRRGGLHDDDDSVRMVAIGRLVVDEHELLLMPPSSPSEAILATSGRTLARMTWLEEVVAGCTGGDAAS